jgi:2-isopropylmalate synthase
MESSGKIDILDTTLRDGEQSPGCTMNSDEKVRIALQLERLGVDTIEAGFAASSSGDFEAIQRVARVISRARVVSLARTRREDVDLALKSVEGASHPGVHIFLATSDIHLQHKLHMTREAVLSEISRAITFAGRHVDHVEFSCEDASRTDWSFLTAVCLTAIEAGARVINLPDTTGYAVPNEYGKMFAHLANLVTGAEKIVWSTHCHNDLGLAVANSLAAIENGARQVECTINGIGERAGNAALEEVVMALRTRFDSFGLSTRVDTKELHPTSLLVSRTIGRPVSPTKAIVGSNAFSHEAGIHQDGILKYRGTYEIIDPKDVGVPSNTLVLGKHSGRRAFSASLADLGVDVSRHDFDKLFADFKQLCDRKKFIYDEDILALCDRVQAAHQLRFELLDLALQSSRESGPRATVVMRVGEARLSCSAVGNGPVDACFNGIVQLTGIEANIVRYSVNSVTEGADALADATCIIECKGASAVGRGKHWDVLLASALSLTHGLNCLVRRCCDV